MNDTRRPGRAVAPVVAVSVIPGVIPHTFDRERGASKAPCDRKLVVAMKFAAKRPRGLYRRATKGAGRGQAVECSRPMPTEIEPRLAP